MKFVFQPNRLVRVLAWVYIFVVPLTFGILDKPRVMVVAAATGCLILAFSYIDKLKRFKGAGFEAEIREAVDEAYATIEKLQGIAVKLAEPIVKEITMHMRMMQFIPLKARLQQVKEIEKSLLNLGVTEEQASKTTSFFYAIYRDDHVKNIIRAVGRDENAPQSLKDELNRYSEEGTPAEFDIHRIFERHGYEPTSDVKEFVKDFEYFEENKSFRRFDVWQ